MELSSFERVAPFTLFGIYIVFMRSGILFLCVLAFSAVFALHFAEGEQESVEILFRIRETVYTYGHFLFETFFYHFFDPATILRYGSIPQNKTSS